MVPSCKLTNSIPRKSLVWHALTVAFLWQGSGGRAAGWRERDASLRSVSRKRDSFIRGCRGVFFYDRPLTIRALTRTVLVSTCSTCKSITLCTIMTIWIMTRSVPALHCGVVRRSRGAKRRLFNDINDTCGIHPPTCLRGTGLAAIYKSYVLVKLSKVITTSSHIS